MQRALRPAPRPHPPAMPLPLGTDQLGDETSTVIAPQGGAHALLATDGVPVTLQERIWMNKLIESNKVAKQLVVSLLCVDEIEIDV